MSSELAGTAIDATRLGKPADRPRLTSAKADRNAEKFRRRHAIKPG
jgi:hypothetical protein